MTKAERLKEIRRRLGPYTALQGSDEPYRLNDAEIARRVAELVEVVLELVGDEPVPKSAVFCTCGIYFGAETVPDPGLAWRHMSHCPHSKAKG
jgi:hypothetical protein